MSADAGQMTKEDWLVIARLRRVIRARIERERREAGTWTPPDGDGGDSDDGE